MTKPVRLEVTPLESSLRTLCLGMLGRGRHMLIKEAAVKLGVSHQYLSSVLNGHERGSMDFWGKLLDLLGVEIRFEAPPRLLTAQDLDAICDEESSRLKSPRPPA